MSKFKVRIVNAALWPIIAPVPQDGGDVENHEFVVKFKMKSDDEYSELLTKGDAGLLREVIVGVGETNDDVQQDETAVNEILKFGYYRLALYNAYQNFLLGIKAKN